MEDNTLSSRDNKKVSNILLDFINKQEIYDSSGNLITDVKEKLKILTSNQNDFNKAIDDYNSDFRAKINKNFNNKNIIVDSKLIKLSNDVKDIVNNAQSISTSIVYFDCDMSQVKSICKSLKDLASQSEKLPSKKIIQFANRLEKSQTPEDIKEIVDDLSEFLQGLLSSYASCLSFIKGFLSLDLKNIITFFANIATGGQAEVIKANAELAICIGQSVQAGVQSLSAIQSQYTGFYIPMIEELKKEIIDAPDELKTIAIQAYLQKQNELQEILNFKI